MKKVVHILVNLIFLLSVVGLSIHKHYSQGKLYSVALFHEAETCCANMEHCDVATSAPVCHCHHKDACSCRNTVEFHRISDVFLPAKYSLVKDTPVEIMILHPFVLPGMQESYGNLSFPQGLHPPPDDSRSLYGFNCVFLC